MTKQHKETSSRYHLDQGGCFTIEDYNRSKVFCNFFPGVAGLWGIPMWVFYVNRGQGISSFGIEGKDKAILEFQPANKAYRLTELQGFRTFVKLRHKGEIVFWEPFQTPSAIEKTSIEQRMFMTAHDLTIEEVNRALGLKARVNYFTLPQEDYPALVRTLTFENISGASGAKKVLEVIDGLPAINAFGLSDWIMKNMSRTVEAWIQVGNLEQRAPYFHLNVEVSDTPDVRHITQGNFYFAFDPADARNPLLEPLVEAKCVFGSSADFQIPQEFLAAKKFQVPRVQQTSNQTPCAMCYSRMTLGRGQKKNIISLTGYAFSREHLKKIVSQAAKKEFIEEKAEQNRNIIAGLQNHLFTNSSSMEFNLYAGQTFLDNVMRGGLPVSFKTGHGPVVFNVFSRKHGDPERDYNYFVLSPTHFSQGNGNYRDVNQNRRHDVWFNKDVREECLKDFLNLIQADGYNPLLVKGLNFCVEDAGKIEALLEKSVQGDPAELGRRLQSDFQPGELLKWISQNRIALKVSPQEFLARILGICRKHLLADHVEGFWSDHWTYNLDLIESYLGLYPETLRSLLIEKKNFTFFQNNHYVLPRDQRYVLTPRGVRQYHALKDHMVHVTGQAQLKTEQGQGETYFTTLMVKLLCLVANKAATFDPSGLGIEMEGGRPNWYDALNGLPGLLGSSLNETLELKRFCLFLQTSLVQLEMREDDKISMFSELAEFIRGLTHILHEEHDTASYWHRANDLKEQYRLQIRKGIDGREEEITFRDIQKFLSFVMAKTDHAMAHARDSKGFLQTYFRHEVLDYAILDRASNGFQHVLPVKFFKHALPLFLEGFVHALRIEKDPIKARKIYRRLKESPLYDKKLKMYKDNADLDQETEEIGRTRIFPKGWLENESIWLHMEYKYLLELLRNGLNEEFFETFRDVLIPFQKPEIYGRSTCENSSFLVSSAHQDASLHGRGFVARLSGSTAEFIHIWLLMNAGLKPFFLNDRGQVCLKFIPVLPGWLFTKEETTAVYRTPQGRPIELKFPKHTYAFNFLGSILVVYHNPKRKNTFGRDGVSVQKMSLTYPQQKNPLSLNQSVIPHDYTLDIRERKVERIDVYFS